MRIAALLVLHTPVAAATTGCGHVPAVAAQPPHTAGQLTPAATHPTPPASGMRAPRDLKARLLHPVGDNKLGASRGSGLAATVAAGRQAPPATERQSAISAVAPLPPATSIPTPSTRVRETVATSVPSGDNGLLRLHRSN